ncbi:unnamed protein product, partial [marine sediment metagenome]
AEAVSANISNGTKMKPIQRIKNIPATREEISYIILTAVLLIFFAPQTYRYCIGGL